MEMLQKQQVILADKIKEDEERKTKDSYTIQTLQKLNKQQSESIKKFTSGRFEVILEILKYSGIIIRDPQIIQAAQQELVQDEANEKR